MRALDQLGEALYLVPAYGRRYASNLTMLKDWDAGEDFRIYPNGPYCSIRDLPAMEGRVYLLRYPDIGYHQVK